jgi:hypothetical protein
MPSMSPVVSKIYRAAMLVLKMSGNLKYSWISSECIRDNNAALILAKHLDAISLNLHVYKNTQVQCFVPHAVLRITKSMTTY